LTFPTNIPIFKNILFSLKSIFLRTSWISALFLLIFALLKFTQLKSFLGITDQNVIDTVYDITFFLYVMSFLTGSLNTSLASYQEHRTDSAEGFEDRFYSEVLPKCKNKILIVIDNLDRTSHGKAIKLLADIKTFLAKDQKEETRKNKAIFLIACDDLAIRKHLENCKFDNPEEFLRKFFNTSLRIPRFLDIELDNYTKDLIRATGINEFIKSRDLIWLITYSFRDNPREIKQFINTLTSQFLLANQIEEKGQTKKLKIFIEHIEFLAKVLIIRQKFPNVYNIIEEKSLREGMPWSQIEFDTLFEEKSFLDKEGQSEEFNQFKKFVSETQHIAYEDLSIFISLRQSEEEQRLPSWNAYLIASQDKQEDKVRKIFSNYDKKGLLDIFDELSRTHIRKNNRSNSLENMYIFASQTIKAAVALNKIQSIPDTIDEFMPNFPTQNDLLKHIEDFEIDTFLLNIYPSVSKFHKEKISASYTSLLGIVNDQKQPKLPDKNIGRIFDWIAKNPEIFYLQHKDIIQYLEQYYSKAYVIEKFLKYKRKEFITETLMNNYLASITNEDLNQLELLKQKLEILEKIL